jgi:hypothetical protein
LVYFMAIWYMYFVVIWYILWSFGIFCGHMVYFVVIWYILWPFWYMYFVAIRCGFYRHAARARNKCLLLSVWITFTVQE